MIASHGIFLLNSDGNLKSSAALGVTKEALDYISTNLKVNAELTEDQYRFVTSKSFTTKNAYYHL